MLINIWQNGIFTSERRQTNERVNGLWLSNEGGGALSFLSQPFVNIVHKGKISTLTWVIEVGSDLQGHLEVTMALEATRMAIQVNIHMDIRVKEVAGFKSKVILIVPLLASL